MAMWVIGKKAYQAKRWTEGRGEGCPESTHMEITGTCPADSRQFSLEPANGLPYPPPPSALWLLSEVWQPRSHFGFAVVHIFCLRVFNKKAAGSLCRTINAPETESGDRRSGLAALPAVASGKPSAVPGTRR